MDLKGRTYGFLMGPKKDVPLTFCYKTTWYGRLLMSWQFSWLWLSGQSSSLEKVLRIYQRVNKTFIALGVKISVPSSLVSSQWFEIDLKLPSVIWNLFQATSIMFKLPLKMFKILSLSFKINLLAFNVC